jgi:dienelactone hydrolase
MEAQRRAMSALSRRDAVLGLASGALAVAGLSAPSFAQEPAGDVEPVKFKSQDVELAGDIYFPAGGAPKLGVVFVHGSGPEKRDAGLARGLAAAGIATLTYDKRGVGESAGAYEANDNVGWDNLHLLAEDAAAAVDALAGRRRLAGAPVGLFGFSQAGWIIPIAAAGDRRVKFMALWSGPVCRVSDQLEYQVATPAQAEASQQIGGGAPELIRRYAAAIRQSGKDVDPVTSLATLAIPGLWVFGGRDGNVPVDLCIAELSKLIAAGHSSFEYQLYPEGGHVNMGPSAADAFRFTVDWMRRKAG